MTHGNDLQHATQGEGDVPSLLGALKNGRKKQNPVKLRKKNRKFTKDKETALKNTT